MGRGAFTPAGRSTCVRLPTQRMAAQTHVGSLMFEQATQRSETMVYMADRLEQSSGYHTRRGIWTARPNACSWASGGCCFGAHW
jgi:hypothetical protein